MKKLSMTVSVLLISISCTMFNSCKKDDDTAYQPKGNYQPAGNYGNASISSSTFTVNSWGYQAPDYYVTLDVPSITQDIINTGAVLVYQTSGTVNVQLPYTMYLNANFSETWTPSFTLGIVTIAVEDSDQTQPNNPGAGAQFKVVVIASRSMLHNPHVNFKDFASVKKAYNLKD